MTSPATSRELPDRITKDTRLCLSLSGRPSNLGTRFHNFLYAELGLDFVYKAFTTDDLPAAVAGIRALGIRGAGVSMPFKEAVIPLVDELEASAAAIDSVNTIVNTPREGRPHLVAYNTDYLAVAGLLAQHGITPAGTPGAAAVLGSGGMAKASLALCATRGSPTSSSSPAPRPRAPRSPRSTAPAGCPRSATSGPTCCSTPPRSAWPVGPRRTTCPSRGPPWRPRAPSSRSWPSPRTPRSSGSRASSARRWSGDRGRRLAGRRAVRAVHRGPAERRPGPPSG